MYSSRNVIRNRIRKIFENGTLYAYGKSFHNMFRFKHNEISKCTIGVHIRITINIKAFVLKFKEKLSQIQLQKNENCILFVASNNMKLALQIVSVLDKVCYINYYPRNNSTIDFQKRKTIDGAHGNYKNMFMKEILTLSHCKDLVVTSGSSASELISELSTFNGNTVYSI